MSRLLILRSCLHLSISTPALALPKLSTVCSNVDPLMYALHNMPLLTKTDHDQMAKATKHTQRRAW